MTTKQIRIGGSFAPPLTAEKLDRYRELASSAPEMVRRKVDELVNMLDVFNQTPRSRNPGTPHPVGRLSNGRVPMVVRLEQEEIHRIWDVVPWGEAKEGEHTNECDEMGRLFEGVQADEAKRNSQKIQTWQQAVQQHIVTKYFPEPGAYQRAKAMTRTVVKTVLALVGVDLPEEEVKGYQGQVEECHAEIAHVLSTKEYEPIPYPQLESTELRDACFHLLWFARELSQDREPLTNDFIQ